jgi:hypothetical protein
MLSRLVVGLTATGQTLASVQQTPGALYLHIPRGSNNRLNEKTANVVNPNRLFWSNNNLRGGYNVGETPNKAYEKQSEQHSMSYFMSANDDRSDRGGSFMTVEWSQLLGCGYDEDGEKIHDCNVKLEYMCQDQLDNQEDVDEIFDAVTLRNGNSNQRIDFKIDGSKLPDPKGACFRDTQTERDLPHSERLNQEHLLEGETAIQACQRICAENEYNYAGVQNANRCYCGNTYNKYGQIPDSECNYRCKADGVSICGSMRANNVYLSGRRRQTDEQESRVDKNARKDSSNDGEKGLHESWEFYDRCEDITPDSGFQAETRSGFECFAERQQIDYQHSTPWITAAVFSDDSFNCGNYANQWDQPKFECVEMYEDDNNFRAHKSIYKNEGSCTDAGHSWLGFYQYLTYGNDNIVGDASTKELCEDMLNDENDNPDDPFVGRYRWGRPMDWHKLSEDVLTEEQCLILPKRPECGPAPTTRAQIISSEDNTYDPNSDSTDPMQLPRYSWRIPKFPGNKDQRCVFRIRQFVSAPQEEVISFMNNEININGDPLYLAIPQWKSRENMAVFEDRSHVFELKHRPQDWAADQVLHNVIVRGKRGNIVQTFPALEYDFVPNRLHISNNNAIHIQWTGSNTHDNEGNSDGQEGDDGEGNGGTDRHNFMQMLDYKQNFPMPYEATTFFKTAKSFLWSASNLGDTLEEQRFNAELAYASGGYYLCKDAATCGDDSYEIKQATAVDRRFNTNSPSFSGIVFVPGNDQMISYMCLRNNNFSNRSQKGRIYVGNNPEPVIGEPVPDVNHEYSRICGKPIYNDEL